MLYAHVCDLLYMKVQINIVCDMCISMCDVLCMYAGCWYCVLMCICTICCGWCVYVYTGVFVSVCMCSYMCNVL